MPQPSIPQKSPYVLKVPAGTYWWCSCGESKNQPHCDGSHQGTGFTPVKFEVDEETQVAFCGCKHTKESPHCDGSHASL